MSRIKSKNTSPELIVRKFLYKNGMRYRTFKKNLPGKPDIVLSKYKTVIFVNGCFWHRHNGCKKSSVPKSNIEYWTKKFILNIERDKKEIQEIENYGWKVLIIWECEVKDEKKLNNILKSLMESI